MNRKLSRPSKLLFHSTTDDDDSSTSQQPRVVIKRVEANANLNSNENATNRMATNFSLNSELSFSSSSAALVANIERTDTKLELIDDELLSGSNADGGARYYERSCMLLGTVPCSNIMRSLRTSSIVLHNYSLTPNGALALAKALLVLLLSFLFQVFLLFL
jgi:hypothetical protein